MSEVAAEPKYRLSFKPNGDFRWWRAGEAIPPDHANVRAATEAEAQIMDRILRQDARGSAPRLSLGVRLRRLVTGATP